MSNDRLYRTEAIVLRRHSIGEADRVLTLFTPNHGKLRVAVRGVRRPKSRLAGHVELFSRVSVLVARGRSLDIVTQAEVRQPMHGLRTDLWKTAYASYVAELIDQFAEERHDGPESAFLYEILADGLAFYDQLGMDPVRAVTDPVVTEIDRDARVSASGPGARMVARAIEIKILGVLGYDPELYNCVGCQQRLQPGENSISAASGGTLCSTCARTDPGARPISDLAIKALRLVRTEPIAFAARITLGDRDQRVVELALRSHITVTLSRQLRVSDVLDRLRAALDN